MDGCQSLMKSVLDDLGPEPRPKMWQKFDIEGIVQKEFVPPGHVVNGKFHCVVLRWLTENIWCKHPDKWHNNSRDRYHDNVPAEVLLIVWQFLASTKTTVIPHPPYSPDHAPCDFFLFMKMKLKLKGWHFDGNEEIQDESQKVIKTPMPNDFQKCIRPWKSCWNRCINAKGDYFDGDGGK